MSSATLFADPQNVLASGKRARVFLLTWLSYATYYLGRKGFGVVKETLSVRFGLSTVQLGDIDTAYLSSYALGQFASGKVGDWLGGRRLVALGMMGAALACVAFGLSSATWLFAVTLALNGLFQATGWPGNVKTMAAWFRPSERGTAMGIWTTHYQVGGLVGTALATLMLAQWGWRYAFIVPGAVIAAVGLAVLLFVPEREKSPNSSATPDSTLPRNLGSGARALLKMPVLWRIGGAYFCLKLIRYSILFWLPFYLKTSLGYSTAGSGYWSISFEVGGVLGSIVVGKVSDLYFPGRRLKAASLFIFALAAALLLYTQVAPLGAVANFAGMALVGFCLFGPDSLISGASAQDLGGAANAATAAGIINGLGSIGAILQGRITSQMSAAFGWNAVFYLFVGLSLVAATALLFGKKTMASAE